MLEGHSVAAPDARVECMGVTAAQALNGFPSVCLPQALL